MEKGGGDKPAECDIAQGGYRWVACLRSAWQQALLLGHGLQHVEAFLQVLVFLFKFFAVIRARIGRPSRLGVQQSGPADHRAEAQPHGLVITFWFGPSFHMLL